jgi:hypothetical protein
MKGTTGLQRRLGELVLQQFHGAHSAKAFLAQAEVHLPARASRGAKASA